MPRPKTELGRRSFLKKGLLGAAGLSALSSSVLSGASPSAGEMKKGKFIFRTLGRTGIRLPVISLGVMNADNENLVRAALEAGIVHLDTAHGYQRGRNEEMIGRVIKDWPRDAYVIATKVTGMPRDPNTGLFSAETKGDTFLQRLDLSLKRLGLEAVDILYLHGVQFRESVLFEPLLKALETAKSSGKARFVGISTHGNQAEAIQAALDSKFYDVVLTAYNFRDQNLEALDKAIARAAGAGLGLIGMKPLAGAYWDKQKTDPINTQAALKWVLRNPHITTVIPGMTSLDHIPKDLAVMEDLTLTPQEWKDLRLEVNSGGLYCRQCRACLPQCPAGLPLPSLMRSYMYAYGYGNLAAAHDLLTSLDIPPHPCQDCASCLVTCSNAFDIKERVTDIVRLRHTPREFLA